MQKVSMPTWKKWKVRVSYPMNLNCLVMSQRPWTPVDSLTIGKYMAYDLGGNWNLLAFRHWALKNYTEEQRDELIVDYPENAQVNY